MLLQTQMKLGAIGFALIASMASISAIAAPAAQLDMSAENLDFSTILKMPKTMVETSISITWSDGKPVVGAKVFDHRHNLLLGLTDVKGKLMLTVPNGSLLRLVEPNYGQQQSLRIVQGKKKNDREMLATTSTSPYSSVMVEGWSL